jgi:hypothetical protein
LEAWGHKPNQFSPSSTVYPVPLLGLEKAGVDFVAADMPNANRLTVCAWLWTCFLYLAAFDPVKAHRIEKKFGANPQCASDGASPSANPIEIGVRGLRADRSTL